MPMAATGVSRPASPERQRESTTSISSDMLLMSAAPGFAAARSSTASFSTSTTHEAVNPYAAAEAAGRQSTVDSSGFGMAGVSMVSETNGQFSIDGMEEMEIYGSGFSGGGRCAFLRVNKLCYAAVGVLVVCSVFLGGALDNHPDVHAAALEFGPSILPPGPPSPPSPPPDKPVGPPPPGPGPAPEPSSTLCTKGLTIKYSDRTDKSPCAATLALDQTCYYTCAHGYTQSGAHICGINGVLRGGGCTFAGCLAKDDVPHTVSDCGDMGSYGDTCDVSCAAGYTDDPDHPTKVHTFDCVVGGNWNGDPITCTNIDECSGHDNVCPDGKSCIDTMGSYECSACQPPKVDDGKGGCADPLATSCTKGAANIPHSSRATIKCTGFSPGISECVYTCDAGYTRTGDNTCDTTGTWVGGACEPSACTSGASIPHSSRNNQISKNQCSGVTGEHCSFTCDEGYVPTGEHICGTDGAWAGGSCNAGSCRRTVVSQIPHMTPGTVPGVCVAGTYTGAPRPALPALNDLCNVTCSTGWNTVGSGQLMCDGIHWESVGAATACEDVDECAEANSPCVALHEACTNTAGSFQCGACSSGYHDAGGVYFSGSHCVGNTCLASKIPNQRASDADCQGSMGAQCQYKCTPGYTATGRLMCSPDLTDPTATNGVWSGGSCVPNQCTGASTVIANSNRVPSNPCEGTVGEECTYQCDDGYAKPATFAVGTPHSSRHVCGPSGAWFGGRCTKVSCPVGGDGGLAFDHTEIEYAHTHVPGQPSTQVAYVSCNSGWQPKLPALAKAHGDAVRYEFTCGNNGKWSPKQATLLPESNGELCTAVDCGSFTVEHGSVTMPNGHVYSDDAATDVVATTLCEDGYSLHNGDKTRTCAVSGVWTGTAPTCRRDTTCPQPSQPSNGRVEYVQGTTTAIYHCNPTYIIHGANKDGSSTACPSTGMPDPVSHDSTCGTRRCMKGVWEGPDPTCDAAGSSASTTCATLPKIAHATQTYSPIGGGKATVNCVSAAFFPGSGGTQLQMKCVQGDWVPPVPVCQENGR